MNESMVLGFTIYHLDTALINLVQRARATESDKFHLCLEAVGPWASYLSSLSLRVFGVFAGLLED